MTEERRCILADKRKGGCSSCAAQCGHYIALHGLNGEGGRVASAGLPKDYRYVTLANSPVRASQPKVYEALDRYAKTFAVGTNKSTYLWSESPGTGKTTSASALANEWIARTYIESLRSGKQPEQLLAYYLDVNSWQELYTGFTRPKIPEAIAEKSSREYYRRMELAKNAPYTVFDDLGVRGATDGFRQDLHDVINHRWTNGKPSAYTSNLPLKSTVPEDKRIAAHMPYDIIDVYDERLYDRIRDNCGVIHFSGNSKRGRR